MIPLFMKAQGHGVLAEVYHQGLINVEALVRSEAQTEIPCLKQSESSLFS